MKVISSSAIAIALLAGAWVLYTYPPGEHSFYPRCAFKMLTGLECPGCGLTRASHHALHGRFGEAFRLNPLLFALGAFGVFAAPSLVRGRQPAFVMKPWFGWGAVVVVMGWWILTNVL